MALEIREDPKNGKKYGRISNNEEDKNIKEFKEQLDTEKSIRMIENRRISQSIKDANNLTTQEYKGNTTRKNKIKRKISGVMTSEAFKKLLSKIGFGIGTGAVVLTAATYLHNILIPNQQTDYTRPTSISAGTTEEENSKALVKKAEQDFLTKYLEAYNKQYNTNYKTFESEICRNSIQEGLVFKVDDKLVTPGKNPAAVKSELLNHGKVTTEDGHDKVVQILVKRDDKTIVLGTYDAYTLEAMYTGTDLSNFDSKLPEFKNLGIDKEKVKAFMELELAKGVEDSKSIEIRLDKYNAVIELPKLGDER